MFKFLIGVGLLMVMSGCCDAQHVVIRSPNGTMACGFRTKVGVVTVEHLRCVGGRCVNKEYDFRLIDSNVGALHEIGHGEPEYFLCRRGRKHAITGLFTRKTEWICDQVFFPGESGLPVYNSKGQVVGSVLGNLVGDRYKGRVCRLRLSLIHI